MLSFILYFREKEKPTVLLIYLHFLYGTDGYPVRHRRPESEKEHY